MNTKKIILGFTLLTGVIALVHALRNLTCEYTITEDTDCDMCECEKCCTK